MQIKDAKQPSAKNDASRRISTSYILSRVCFSPWRATEQQGHLTVSHGLLSQIIIDNDGMPAVVAKPLAHGTSREGCDVLQRSSLGGCRSHNNGVFHRVILLQSLDQLCYSRSFLANSNVHTVELFGFVIGIVPASLIQYGVEGNGSLPSLAISDDKLALSTANWHHSIDRFETGLNWLVDRVARQNTRCLKLSSVSLCSFDRALAINGVTQRVYNTAEERRANRYINLGGCKIRSVEEGGCTYDFSSTLDGFAFLHETIRTEKHNTNLTSFEVHAHALDPRSESVLP